MSEGRFDVEAVFDAADYGYFYGPLLTPERTARDVDLIWRLLDLRAGAAVLDLACGHGRITNPLAARGCTMMGLDVTPAFLDQARHDAARQGLAVEYVAGDMRSLPWIDRFDGILNGSPPTATSTTRITALCSRRPTALSNQVGRC